MRTGGFWTTKTLQRRLPKIIEPFDASAIKACAYELCVGGEAFVSGNETKKIILKDGETIAIPPGQIALVITKEKIIAPLDSLGFLSIKSGVKLRGLINISGFHVDPGFKGNLVFSMYNAGTQTIHLGMGSKLFLIWFCSCDGGNNVPYNGEHNNQSHIPDNAVTNAAARMPSPFTLEDDIRGLQLEMKSLENKSLSDQGSLEARMLSKLANVDCVVRVLITLVSSLLIGLAAMFIRQTISQQRDENHRESKRAESVVPPKGCSGECALCTSQRTTTCTLSPKRGPHLGPGFPLQRVGSDTTFPAHSNLIPTSLPFDPNPAEIRLHSTSIGND